jgi:bacterioferritin
MEELISLLMEALNEEWKAALQYQVHASQLRGIFRDPIGDQMKEHADDECGHAEQLTVHLFGKGLPIEISVPQVDVSSNPIEMISQDLESEVAAIDRYARILDIVGDAPEFTDTRVLIEAITTDEVSHQDEFAALLRAKVGPRAEAIGGPGGPVTAAIAGQFLRIADQSDRLSERFGTGGVVMLKRADSYTKAAETMIR